MASIQLWVLRFVIYSSICVNPSCTISFVRQGWRRLLQSFRISLVLYIWNHSRKRMLRYLYKIFLVITTLALLLIHLSNVSLPVVSEWKNVLERAHFEIFWSLHFVLVPSFENSWAFTGSRCSFTPCLITSYELQNITLINPSFYMVQFRMLSCPSNSFILLLLLLFGHHLARADQPGERIGNDWLVQIQVVCFYFPDNKPSTYAVDSNYHIGTRFFYIFTVDSPWR